MPAPALMTSELGAPARRRIVRSLLTIEASAPAGSGGGSFVPQGVDEPIDGNRAAPVEAQQREGQPSLATRQVTLVDRAGFAHERDAPAQVHTDAHRVPIFPQPDRRTLPGPNQGGPRWSR